MENVRVIARRNVLDMQWGQEAVVPANAYVEMLIQTGSLELMEDIPADRPAMNFERKDSDPEPVRMAAPVEPEPEPAPTPAAPAPAQEPDDPDAEPAPEPAKAAPHRAATRRQKVRIDTVDLPDPAHDA